MQDNVTTYEEVSQLTDIPFGPHHTALFEPIQINLTLEEELIREVSFVKGYCERAIETLLIGMEYKQGMLMAERTCGMCSLFHSMAYCSVIERIKSIDVPQRAKFLRIIWMELARIQNHYLRLALTTDAMGFESMSSLILKARQHVLDILVLTTGSRIILPVNTVGGVRKDISDEILAIIMIELKNLKKTFDLIQRIFINDFFIKKRMSGVGVLSPLIAKRLGAVGPVLRSTGIASDARQYDETYKKLGFACLVQNGGDAYARTLLRVKEIGQSIELINNAIYSIPSGDTRVAVKGMLTGEDSFYLEQPEGMLEYFIVGKGRNIKDIRINTASQRNFKLLYHVLKGSNFSDLPIIFMSMGICVACLDK